MTRPIRLGSTPAPLTLWLVHGSPFVAALRADRPWPAAPALVLDDGTELLAELDADDSTVAAWLVDSVTIAGLLDRDPERVTLLDPASRMAYAHGLVRSTETVPGELSTTIPATGRLDVRQLDADRIQLTTNVTNVQEVSELSGTGSPVGTVDAELGQTYRDTAGTNGALRWIKTGPALTGWRVLTGDTGWRDLSDSLDPAILHPEWADLSRFEVRRFDNAISLALEIPVADNLPVPMYGLNTGVTLPIGLRGDTSVIQIPATTQDSVMKRTRSLAIFGNGRVYFYAAWGKTTLGVSADATFTYSGTVMTSEPWPATLPGVPL